MPNHLEHESSPYLQQHRNNPVDWYPWGDEALQRAKDEDKPVFLSIGYSSCHWCHVMEHESFEDDATAQLLNEHFISIKVDREERPDIDSIYMLAVQAMTGHGGWPLNVFLTPDLVPFYGGTYWPPEERQGMPAFRNVIRAVATTFEDKREDVEENAEQVKSLLKTTSTRAPREGVLTRDALEEAHGNAAKHFDQLNGGFGSAPKFPQPSVVEFVMRRYLANRQSATARVLNVTLDHMAQGGMYDQIGGGFHRYAVDAIWLVPHFEKMLYDNAQMARLYVDGAKLLGEERHAAVASDIFDYVLREMTGPNGEFYSTQDADTEGEEGKFYVWTLEELSEALGPEDARIAAAVYGITPDGNFEGHSIPTRETPLAGAAEALGIDAGTVESKLPAIREQMRTWRAGRTQPGRDDKVIASWNGMMLRAFAEAAAALDRPDLLEAARRNASFITQQMMTEEGLHHIWQNGSGRIAGYLDDYVNVIDGFLALYQADFSIDWLDRALHLTEIMLEKFGDENSGLLYDSSNEHEPLVSRARDFQDGATPSGNAVAAEVMIKIGRLTSNRDLERRGSAILTYLVRPMTEQPLGFGRALVALDTYLGVTKEAVVAGPAQNEETRAFLSAIGKVYQPHMVVGLAEPHDTELAGRLPFLEGRVMRDGKVAAYVCEHFACLPPVTDPAAIADVVTRGSGVSWTEF
ncbi:MAG: thioredoxin domain-containing protein [Thermomicrobiales bacterium]|nr:thioredoxin domain-containing protein [Thermomicrobiales bacterium]